MYAYSYSVGKILQKAFILRVKQSKFCFALKTKVLRSLRMHLLDQKIF